MSTDNIFHCMRTRPARYPTGVPKAVFDNALKLATREVEIGKTGLRFTQHLAIVDLQIVELFSLPEESRALLNSTVDDFECWEQIKW